MTYYILHLQFSFPITTACITNCPALPSINLDFAENDSAPLTSDPIIKSFDSTINPPLAWDRYNGKQPCLFTRDTIRDNRAARSEIGRFARVRVTKLHVGSLACRGAKCRYTGLYIMHNNRDCSLAVSLEKRAFQSASSLSFLWPRYRVTPSQTRAGQ